MLQKRWTVWARAAVLPAAVLAVMVCAAGAASAQAPSPKPAQVEAPQERGFADFLKAGGVVGYTILLLSVVGTGLVIDAFLHVQTEKLMPPNIVEEAEKLARKGQFSQLLSFCQASDTLICQVIRTGLSQGSFGLPAVRQAMQEQGVKDITRINHRVNYMGFLGAIAPMMGLLGTVIGMIGSFNVLGSSKGAARPDELAKGIAFALVTTCEGLVLAIPMMFFHNYFRDRVARLSQECSSVCERMLRMMGAALEARVAPKPAEAAAQAGAVQQPAGQA
jgi:biopolymer transport protein ExbB